MEISAAEADAISVGVDGGFFLWGWKGTHLILWKARGECSRNLAEEVSSVWADPVEQFGFSSV